jgi:hypothetical protein
MSRESFAQLLAKFHSTEMNMKLIGNLVGAFKMIGRIEASWTQTAMRFSLDAENLGFSRLKSFVRLDLLNKGRTATQLLHQGPKQLHSEDYITHGALLQHYFLP